jgi:hypothetical protein
MKRVYPGIWCEVLSIALVKDKSDVCLISYRPKYCNKILCMLDSKDWTCCTAYGLDHCAVKSQK